MVIYKAKDYDDMSRKAANIISAQMILNPHSVLGLATGSTPMGTYRQLVEWYRKGDLDFSGIVTVNLDEYRGLSGENDQSYRYFMDKNLFDHVNIRKENTFVPDGLAKDIQKACDNYDKIIRVAGGIDLQLLGLGGNGHIGFNEPGDEFVVGTHGVNLAETTIRANSRFFEKVEDVPRQAYTMGINHIMNSRKVLLIASGKEKAQALYDALYGPITPRVPASILQLHNHVIIVADEDAMSVIKSRKD